jgi:signal transduction histidine kinase
VSPTELFRSTTFRFACALAGFFGGTTLLLFAFIYSQTAGFETQRIDALISEDAKIEAARPPEAVLRFVTTRVTGDFHRLTFAGLFDSQGRRIAGNLARLPDGVLPDGEAHVARLAPSDQVDMPVETVRVVERPLADGTILVVARYSEEVERLSQEVLRALELGLIPAVALSLLAGIVMSWRTQTRVKEVNEAAARIMRGHLRERLPVRGSNDDFDRLALSVNRMLDEIERLLDEVKATGDEIAHDLRTPLTRVRTRLENARRKPAPAAELEAVIDRSMLGLDQALAVITALLRIREIEAGRRRAGFREVDLAEVVVAIDELYQPIAEEKNIGMTLEVAETKPLIGDKDLLIEAVGNLVDNAIKFTPEGGVVRLILGLHPGGPLIRIADTGPGIAAAEREVVFLRFHRSARDQHVDGVGLGLSLVAAIAKLHDIRIVLHKDTPGCVIDLEFGGPAAATTEPRTSSPTPQVPG